MGGASYAAVSAAARAAGEREYGCAMPVDLLPLDYPRFRRCRRAVNHVAHHIARDGIPMTQVPFSALDPDAAGDGDDGYPDNWPDISERLRDALDSFRSMRHDYNDGAEKYMGRHAHETLEPTYKALISALGASYPRTHNLRDLERLLDRLSEPARRPHTAQPGVAGSLLRRAALRPAGPAAHRGRPPSLPRWSRSRMPSSRGCTR